MKLPPIRPNAALVIGEGRVKKIYPPGRRRFVVVEVDDFKLDVEVPAEASLRVSDRLLFMGRLKVTHYADGTRWVRVIDSIIWPAIGGRS